MAHLSVARVAEALGVSWNTANDAIPWRVPTMAATSPAQL